MKIRRNLALAVLLGFTAGCNLFTATEDGEVEGGDLSMPVEDAGDVGDVGGGDGDDIGAPADVGDTGVPTDDGTKVPNDAASPDVAAGDTSNNADMSDATADDMAGGDVADVCVPETEAELCTAMGAECGAATFTDSCGDDRPVDCGACGGDEICQGQQCVCVAESDSEFCARLSKNCGDVTDLDNCGVSRTANCGTCTAPAACGGGGTPNVCGCAAQSDVDFCASYGATCGSLTAIDDCDQMRTVNCGSCTAPDTCGGGGVANECGCTPESDADLCMSAIAECGTLSADDSCGNSRTVDCGTCSSGTCNASNQCESPTTTLNFTSTVNTSIPPNGNELTDQIAVSGCGTLDSITVDIDITHTYRGDIRLELQSPSGTVVLLKQQGLGDGAANVIGNYPMTLTPAESLDAFAGENADGDWTLTVTDNFSQDNGDLNSWGLNLVCS